jgi:hypothetical protein
MRSRHWEQLSAALGFPFNPERSFTLRKAEELKLLEHVEAISKVDPAWRSCCMTHVTA